MKHALLSESEQLSTHLHGDDIKDTKKLQMKSLVEFMRSIGYEMRRDWFNNNHTFYSILKENAGRNNISVRTAIDLHNGGYIDWHGNRLREPFNFNEYLLTRARAAKVVKLCKLQYSKKQHKFVVQSHKVQFVKESYYYIFMENQ